MEELFVYALLYSEGFDVWPLYANKLDRLFMEDMENEAYLTLEGMAPKEAVCIPSLLWRGAASTQNISGRY